MPKKKQPTNRISALRAIIDTLCKAAACKPPAVCRHLGEKEAARATLRRILGNVKEQAPAAHREDPFASWGEAGSPQFTAAWAAIMERGYDEHGSEWWTGAKHNRASWTGPLTYAAAIRADIAMARKAGRHSLMDLTADSSSALSVTSMVLYQFDPIGEAPAPIRFSVKKTGGGIDITVKGVPDGWGWEVTEHTNHDGRVWQQRRATEELKTLGKELRRVGNAYNASYGSNMATDCHANAFTLSVLAENPSGGHTLIG